MLATQASRLCLIGFVHHVDVVVDDVTTYDSADGRHLEDRRTLNVTLAGVDQVDGLTVDQDLVAVQHLGQHGFIGEPARKREVQYLLVLLNSASQVARPTTSGAANPRDSGECSR